MNEAMLSVVIVGADIELGLEATQQFIAQAHQAMGLSQRKNSATAIRAKTGLCADVNLTNVAKLKQVITTVRAQVVLSLIAQIVNSLLSDGKGWKDFDKTLSATITALLEALRESGIQLLVHASYAFLPLRQWAMPRMPRRIPH